MKQATLLFLLDSEKILLAMKKRGFGAGRWNGVGGKVTAHETVRVATVRECQEEIQVIPRRIIEVATLNFYFPSAKKDWNQRVIVFTSKDWEGEPTETEEMAPKWFPINEIPYSEMWSDDQHWLPEVLKGKYIAADFHFDDNDRLVTYRLETR
jgi:ADP-ribose pyrophosphatase YjhB (NUDIX family)